MHNFYTLLEVNSHKFSTKSALVCEGTRLTYAELSERINRLASSLKRIGVGHGTSVGIMLPNGVSFVEVFFALQKLGAVAALFHVKNVPGETTQDINAIGCGVFIYHGSCQKCISANPLDTPTVKTWICDGQGCTTGHIELDELRANGDPEWGFFQSVSEKDDALTIFTSGTTGGAGTAAIYDQLNLFMWLVVSELSTTPYSPDYVMLNYAPMSHLGGLGRLLRTLSKGGTVVLMPKFSTEGYLSEIAAERPNAIFLVPPTVAFKLQEANASLGVDLSCVRRVETGATIISPDAVSCMFELFPNAKVVVGYGSSECNPTINMELTAEDAAACPNLIQSIGRATYGTQIKLVNDEGIEVERAQAGEAWIKSLSHMTRYSTRASTFVDGWWPSGDVLRQDAGGYYYFVDRKNDIIKSGGEKIFSPEVERVLAAHPAVETCAVLGIESPRYGERVVGAVVARKESVVSEDELVRYCKDNLAEYKAPKRILFIQEMPVTSTGKINKTQLRNQLSAIVVTDQGLGT